MWLGLLNIGVSLATFCAVFRIGVWAGRVDEKLKEHARRIGRLEGPIEVHPHYQGD